MQDRVSTPSGVPQAGAGDEGEAASREPMDDTRLVSLVMQLAFYEQSVDPEHIVHEFAPDGAMTAIDIVCAARERGLKSRLLIGNAWQIITPSMSVQAEIKTGKRRAISFFLSPSLRYRDEGLRER